MRRTVLPDRDWFIKVELLYRKHLKKQLYNTPDLKPRCSGQKTLWNSMGLLLNKKMSESWRVFLLYSVLWYPKLWKWKKIVQSFVLFKYSKWDKTSPNSTSARSLLSYFVKKWLPIYLCWVVNIFFYYVLGLPIYLWTRFKYCPVSKQWSV